MEILKGADITIPAAAIAIYLVVWITRSLDKKLDAIAANQIKTNDNLAKILRKMK